MIVITHNVLLEHQGPYGSRPRKRLRSGLGLRDRSACDDAERFHALAPVSVARSCRGLTFGLSARPAVQYEQCNGRHLEDKRRVDQVVQQKMSSATNARPELNHGAGLDAGKISLGQGLVGPGTFIEWNHPQGSGHSECVSFNGESQQNPDKNRLGFLSL